MSFEALLNVLASIVTICGGIAAAILFVRNRYRKDQREVILGVTSVLATILAIGFLFSQTIVQGNRNTGLGLGSSQHTTLQTTVAQTPTSIPSPTSTPVTHVAANTVLCASGTTDFWQSWNPSGSWHVLNGNLLNDGNPANGSYDLLMAPSTCQPLSGNPDYQVTMKIKAIKCGGGDVSGFGAWLRASPDSGSMGGYVFYTCSAFDRAVVATGNFNSLGSHDEVGTGTTLHTYTMKVQGNVETFMRDGITLVQVTDNSGLSPGEIALFCSYGNQIDISSFSVTTL